MKSRIATIFTMVLLLAGTGGAIALGTTTSSGGAQGGAACGQYNPGHQKNGKPCKRQNHNCGKHKNQLCPAKPKTCHYKVNGHTRSYKCPASTHKTTKKHKTTTKHKSTKKTTTKKN